MGRNLSGVESLSDAELRAWAESLRNSPESRAVLRLLVRVAVLRETLDADLVTAGQLDVARTEANLLREELARRTALYEAELDRFTGRRTLAQVERDHVLLVLGRLKGNKTLAALELGVSVKTVYNLLARWEAEDEKCKARG